MWFDILKAPVQMELDIDPNLLSMPHGMRNPKPQSIDYDNNYKDKKIITEQSSDSGSDDSGSDDSDVGEQWRSIRSLMVQSPRGPKKRQLVQALSILATAAIDPVNQKNLAIQAKQKLKEAFPTEG